MLKTRWSCKPYLTLQLGSSQHASFMLWTTTPGFLSSPLLPSGKTRTKRLSHVLNSARCDHSNKARTALDDCLLLPPHLAWRRQVSRRHGRRKREGGRGCPQALPVSGAGSPCTCNFYRVLSGFPQALLSSFLGEKQTQLGTTQNVIMPGSSHASMTPCGCGLSHLL